MIRKLVAAVGVVLTVVVMWATAVLACDGYWSCTWYDGVVACYWYGG